MNPLKKQYRQLILSLFAKIAVIGIIGRLVFYWGFPSFYFQWYPLIPAYFLLLGLLMSMVMYHYSKYKSEKILTAYMMSRAIKIVITVGCLLLYYWLIRDNMAAVLLTTLVFYFLYLMVETWIFFRFEKMTRHIH